MSISRLGPQRKEARGGVIAEPRAPVAAVDWLGVLPRPSTLRCALEGAPLSYCHLYWIFALDHLLSVVP